MIFGCQSSIIHAGVDIHIDIEAGISMQGHSAMNIRKQKYPLMDIHVFMDLSSTILALMDIRIHRLAMESRSRDALIK